MAADDRVVPIGDLKPGMRNLTCVFIVIDRGTTSNTKDGSLVRKCRVADRSGSILFSVWNKEADAIEESDIVRLNRGYASVWKGDLVLYCGKYGVVEKLGEFTMVYSEAPDMSVWEPDSSAPSSLQHSHSNQLGSSRPQSLTRGGVPLVTNRNGNNHHHHPMASPGPPPPADAPWTSRASPSTPHSHVPHGHPPNDHTHHNHHPLSHTKPYRHTPNSNGHTRYHPYPQQRS